MPDPGSEGDTAHRRWAKFRDHSISSGQQAKSSLACVLQERRIFDGQGTMKKQADAPQPRRGSAQRPVAGANHWPGPAVSFTGGKSCRKRTPTALPRPTSRCSAAPIAGRVLQVLPENLPAAPWVAQTGAGPNGPAGGDQAPEEVSAHGLGDAEGQARLELAQPSPRRHVSSAGSAQGVRTRGRRGFPS